MPTKGTVTHYTVLPTLHNSLLVIDLHKSTSYCWGGIANDVLPDTSLNG